MKNSTKNFAATDSSAKAKFMSYIIYMIAGSVFKGTRCLTPGLEDNFEKVYISGSEELQIFLEDKCIEFVEGRLLAELPENFVSSVVNVSFLEPDKRGRRAVRFEAEGFKLEMKAKYTVSPYFIADLYIDTPFETRPADGEAADRGAA